MRYICVTWLKYLRNDVDKFEMAKISLVWLTYFANGLNMLK